MTRARQMLRRGDSSMGKIIAAAGGAAAGVVATMAGAWITIGQKVVMKEDLPHIIETTGPYVRAEERIKAYMQEDAAQAVRVLERLENLGDRVFSLATKVEFLISQEKRP